jgi:hypothetical protein
MEVQHRNHSGRSQLTVAYAGIGSRQTPSDVLLMMRAAAARLAERGFILRTGGAEGADRAFFDGAQSVGGRIELYLPWPTFWTPPSFAGVEFQTYPSHGAYELAERYHSNWKNLRRSIRSLHARNAHQVLGHELDEPAKFILCWTPEGSGVGGTGQALRMAPDYGIPVIDLGRPEARERLGRWLATQSTQREAQAVQENTDHIPEVSGDVPSLDALRAQ